MAIGDVVLKVEGEALDNIQTLSDGAQAIDDQIRVLAGKSSKMKRQMWEAIQEIADGSGVVMDREKRAYRINVKTGEVKDAGPVGFDFLAGRDDE